MSAGDKNVGATTKPRVTVVIPCHNYGHFLLDAINSVLKQDYDGRLSVTIVDDGSTDDTWAKIESLSPNKQLNSPKSVFNIDKVTIQAFKNEQALGPSGARNKAIEATIKFTDIYAMLDADDYWETTKISKSVAKMQEDMQSIGIVYTDNIGVQEGGVMVREFREPFNRNRLLTHNMIHSGSCVNAEAFRKIGLYDPALRVAEDLDLWLRITDIMLAVHIPESLVFSRVHKESTTTAVSSAVWQQAWQYIGQKCQQRYGQKH